VVTRQVLGYFVRNPKAVDSLEGIARWRMVDEVLHLHVSATHESLAWLVERGLLQCTYGPGHQPLFSLDPVQLPEAEKLLAELTVAPDPSAGDKED